MIGDVRRLRTRARRCKSREDNQSTEAKNPAVEPHEFSVIGCTCRVLDGRVLGCREKTTAPGATAHPTIN
jgi:hypothetical protein